MATPIPDARRPEYLKLLELHNLNRIDYNARKWETVKFFEGIFTVLFGATIAAIIAVERDHLWSNQLLGLAIAALALFSALAVLIGRANLRRESRLLYLEEAQMFKIAHLLQLDRTLDEDEQWLPGDTSLLMPKWQSSSYGAGQPPPPIPPPEHAAATAVAEADPGPGRLEEWVRARMSKHVFLDHFDRLFMTEAVFAMLLGIVIICRIQW